MDKLSVIIPIYNVEEYLEKCIESVLNQTFPVSEIILVDDGSTDNSGHICDQYAEKYSLIQVIHKENGGLVSARKAGLKKAMYPYAAYVDSDDWIEPTMYEKLMSIIVKYDADVVTSGKFRDYAKHSINEFDNIEPGVYEGSNLDLLLSNLIDTNVFHRSNMLVHVYNKIYRTDLLRLCQYSVPNQVNAGEDAAVVYPVLFLANRVVVTRECFYHYCIRNNSIMGVLDENEQQRMDCLFQYLEEKAWKQTKRIPNLLHQIKIFETYMSLLRTPKQTIKYNNQILYPFGKIDIRNRIVLYGSGRFGKQLYSILKEIGFPITAWVDKNSNGINISPVSSIRNKCFDYVIIAVLLADVVQEITTVLLDNDVPQQKILYIKPEMILS